MKSLEREIAELNLTLRQLGDAKNWYHFEYMELHKTGIDLLSELAKLTGKIVHRGKL